MGRKLSDATKEEIYQDAFERIESELEYLDIKPFSKNIIELRLRSVANKCGKKMANALIDDLCLEAYGWKKQ